MSLLVIPGQRKARHSPQMIYMLSSNQVNYYILIVDVNTWSKWEWISFIWRMLIEKEANSSLSRRLALKLNTTQGYYSRTCNIIHYELSGGKKTWNLTKEGAEKRMCKPTWLLYHCRALSQHNLVLSHPSQIRKTNKCTQNTSSKRKPTHLKDMFISWP